MLSQENVKIWMVWNHFWHAASENPLVNYYYTHNASTYFESEESEQTQTANAVFLYHLHNSHHNSLDINLNTHVEDIDAFHGAWFWRDLCLAQLCAKYRLVSTTLSWKIKEAASDKVKGLLFNCLLIMLCPQVGCLLGIWEPSINRFMNTVEATFSIADTSLYRTKWCGPDWICITRNTLQLSGMWTPHYSVLRMRN